jgi:hypothetical protein
LRLIQPTPNLQHDAFYENERENKTMFHIFGDFIDCEFSKIIFLLVC